MCYESGKLYPGARRTISFFNASRTRERERERKRAGQKKPSLGARHPFTEEKATLESRKIKGVIYPIQSAPRPAGLPSNSKTRSWHGVLDREHGRLVLPIWQHVLVTDDDVILPHATGDTAECGTGRGK